MLSLILLSGFTLTWSPVPNVTKYRVSSVTCVGCHDYGVEVTGTSWRLPIADLEKILCEKVSKIYYVRSIRTLDNGTQILSELSTPLKVTRDLLNDVDREFRIPN